MMSSYDEIYEVNINFLISSLVIDSILPKISVSTRALYKKETDLGHYKEQVYLMRLRSEIFNMGYESFSDFISHHSWQPIIF